jgi:hypothetical protein
MFFTNAAADGVPALWGEDPIETGLLAGILNR